jgi:hypothetical protein
MYVLSTNVRNHWAHTLLPSADNPCNSQEFAQTCLIQAEYLNKSRNFVKENI